jgi:hypothetical protein
LNTHFPNRNPSAGTDTGLDQMFERALSAREFALAHGWPLPQPFRPKWRRVLAVVLGSIIATLLLGQALERLRQTGRETIAPPAPIQVLPQPTPAPQPTPVFRPVFDPPRAQLVRLPSWRVGEARLVTIQNCMVYINTLMIQKLLAQPHWQGKLTPRDYAALTPLIWEHVNPYGRFDLDMNTRLALL